MKGKQRMFKGKINPGKLNPIKRESLGFTERASTASEKSEKYKTLIDSFSSPSFDGFDHSDKERQSPLENLAHPAEHSLN